MGQINVSDNLDWGGPLIGRLLQLLKENPQAEGDLMEGIPKLVAYEFRDLGISGDDIEIVRLTGPAGWPVIRIHGPNAQEAERRYFEEM